MPDDPKVLHATHEAIMAQMASDKRETDERLGRGEVRFAEIFDAIKRIETAVAPIPAIQVELAETKAEVSATKAETRKTKEIVEAWTAVKTMGKFIKWAAGIVAAAAVVFAAIKGVVGIHDPRG